MLRARITGLLLIVVVSICATFAAATGIEKWRTPGGQLFFGDHPPARATVQAARLPRDARVEIEAIAVLD